MNLLFSAILLSSFLIPTLSKNGCLLRLSVFACSCVGLLFSFHVRLLSACLQLSSDGNCLDVRIRAGCLLVVPLPVVTAVWLPFPPPVVLVG